MRDLALTEIVRVLGKEFGQQPAVITPEESRSFLQLDEESNRIAQGLLSLGISSGERVGCLTKHGEDCQLLQLGANKLGAVNVPINWRLSPSELEYIINAAGVRLLVADEIFLPILETAKAPTVLRTLVSGKHAGPGSFAGWRQGFAPEDPEYRPMLDETALLLGSSGTTGRPKLIEITYNNLLMQCRNGGTTCPTGDKGWVDFVDPAPVFLNVAPNFHVSGSVNAISTLYRGGTSVFLPEFDPARTVEAIGRHGVTETFLVPTMMRAILDLPNVESANFRSLQLIGYGGSPISETLLRRALSVFQCDFVQVYGMTELSGTFTCLRPEEHDPDGNHGHLLRSAGRPIRGAELRIVDPETHSDLEPGAIGEIWARSKHNMKGYLGNEAATAEVFPEGRDEKGGWYRTGDIGYLRDGYLYIHDRLRDMVISGGENVYPAEVENVLAAHPAVADVAVIGVPNEKWGEVVKACVELRPGAPASEAELIAFTRGRLAHYKCPKSIDFVDVLPRNPSGKILRRVLRERYWSDRDRLVS